MLYLGIYTAGDVGGCGLTKVAILMKFYYEIACHCLSRLLS